MCETRYCCRPSKNKYCDHCCRERKKERNPYRYWLGVLRRNAKRRGHYFAVSFEYWVKFCDETGYLALKGRYKWGCSVDRIDPRLGYADGNLQMLTVGDNSSKGVKVPVWNYIEKRFDIVEKRNQVYDESENIF
jgi:hypothetical protein